MKINNNCARKILLEIENIPYGETITVAKLQEKIAEYTIEEVLSLITLFNKTNYIIVLDKVSYDDNDVFRDNKIKGLTERGYRNLDLIRNENTWNLIKEKIDDFDNLSIFTIFDIAAKINNVQHNELFNLPKELLIQNNRL